jgi:protein-S-isoprenylcysteine O-methyltransferase Ste14
LPQAGTTHDLVGNPGDNWPGLFHSKTLSLRSKKYQNTGMALQESFEKQGVWLFRYRGVIPIFILFIGAALYAWMKFNSGNTLIEKQPYEFYYELLCLLVGLLGLVIRAYTVGHTPRNTSGRNVARQVADSLNTTGIYSVVRHPLYLGNFFMWLGPAMLTAHPWFILVFCLFYWIYYERIMFAEEQFLRGKFGAAYLEWSEKVPAFLPRFKGFVKSDLSFSWKKVLKKEKNGFAALFLIFSAFDLAGELIQGQSDYNLVFLGGFALSFLAYFVLKALKVRGALDETGR